MKKNAFTLMEILIAMSIIGVLAAATINTLGKVNASKAKESFRNCFNHMEQTVSAIISDETIYPNVPSGEGIGTDGRQKRKPIKNFDINESTGVGTASASESTLFPRMFMKKSAVTSSTVDGKYYRFTMKNGSYWVVYYKGASGNAITNPINSADYVITFDVNGPTAGQNCPFKGDNLATKNTTCSEPDTYKFGLTPANKIVADNTITTLSMKRDYQFLGDMLAESPMVLVENGDKVKFQ